jgi:hypothetical protein
MARKAIRQSALLGKFVAVCEFADKKFSAAKLYPIDRKPRPAARSAWPAGIRSPVAERVLSRLQRLSKRYGTVVEVKDGLGIIRF